MLHRIERLSALRERYDVLLSDVWGVIHNGAVSFPGPCAALAAWREEVGPVILVSNAARPSPEVSVQLDGLAIQREAYSALVTSGDVTRVLLAERAPGPALRIGPEGPHRPLYEGLGMEFAEPEQAKFISCTGLVDDEVETPEDYRPLLTRAAALKLPMICANPDKVVQRGARLIYCAGALAELYEALGGQTIMAGKPHPPIYRACLAKAAEIAGRPVDPTRVLAIGDGVATDIAGANAAGLDALFIAGGIHEAETRDLVGGFDHIKVERLLAERRAEAAWGMDALAW